MFQNNLGQALERLGHVGQAKKAYEAALAADSTYGKASTALARVTGLTEVPGAVEVDLATLADEFRTTVAAVGVRRARYRVGRGGLGRTQ